MGKTKERAWRDPDPRKKKTARFVSSDAEKRYNKCMSKRMLFMERGFTWSESNSLEFPDIVTRVIRSHKWETFCQNPPPVSVPLVREFYANFDSARPDCVHVRGKLVDASAAAINSLFSLTEYHNTLYEVASELSPQTMRVILKELYAKGTVLYTQTFNKATIFSRFSLKMGLNIWMDFIKHNLLPSSHDTIVQKDSAVLLYCIKVGKPINVGKVIAEEMRVCASRNNGSLWFPALITRLCERHNVPFPNREPIQQPYSPFPLDLVKQRVKGKPIEIAPDQQTGQLDHDLPSSTVTISLAAPSPSPPPQNDSLGHANPANVSSPHGGIICVQGYKVKQSVAPILEAIFKKHGDIAAKCVFKSLSVRSSFLEEVCEVVRQIQTNDFIEKLEEIECQVLSDTEAANIDVSWLRAHLKAIHKREEATRTSSLLMEMKANTILVKRAAEMDLREVCAKLMSAQEQFVKAERCVRVLHLVEKNINNSILESKADLDLWVKQPIL